jgi:hypothetical protein
MNISHGKTLPIWAKISTCLNTSSLRSLSFCKLPLGLAHAGLSQRGILKSAGIFKQFMGLGTEEE